MKIKSILFLTYFLLVSLFAIARKNEILELHKSKADSITFKDLMVVTVANKEIIYKKVNEKELKLYVFQSKKIKKGEKLPVVLIIHGGGWSGGNPNAFFPHAQYFAQRGAVAICVQYRLISPLGTSVAECIMDVKSAIRYIREHANELGIDPNKIASFGDSAGGHLAAALGTIESINDPNDNLKTSAFANAMLLYNPCVDFFEMPIGKSALKHKFDNFKKADTSKFTKIDSIFAKSISPLYQVNAKTPPSLVIHGKDDKIILYQQAVQWNDTLSKKGIKSKILLYENTKHAFVIPNYRAPENVVVDAVIEADKFLIELGFLNGEPNLKVNAIPSWQPKK